MQVRARLWRLLTLLDAGAQIMGTYRSRLRKVFFFFAAKDSGSHRHMDIREFLFMLKVRAKTSQRTRFALSVAHSPLRTQSLGVADNRNLTLAEAARVVVTCTGFVGDAVRHQVGLERAAVVCTRYQRLMPMHISAQLDFHMFCDALARCADVKTHDGVMSVASRLDNFLVSDFFQKIRSKTNLANLWL